MKKNTTLYDVAKKAGVSYQTVSRVINNSAHVAEKTKLLVNQAIKDLNYVPNYMAQNLAIKNTRIIGLIITDLLFNSQPIIMSTINKTAEQYNYTVIIKTLSNTSIEACTDAILKLKSQRVEGIIISSPVLAKDLQATIDILGNLPHVFLDTNPKKCHTYITHNLEKGAELSIDHLVSLGHRDIVLITGPNIQEDAKRRLIGWQKGFEKYNLTPTAQYEGDWLSSSGYDITISLLKNNLKFSAIVVGNDQMAIGVMHALIGNGFHVPNDISVIGYDDHADSVYLNPSLTTIKRDFDKLAIEAVLRIIESIQQNKPLSSLIIDTELVVRQSTAAYKKTQ